jgi:hypothetical protein
MSLKHEVHPKIQFHTKEGKLIQSKIFLETLGIKKQIAKYLRFIESDIISSYSQN